MEVLGEHTVLTLPTDIAKQDAEEIEASILRFDAIYKQRAELRGKRPHHGQPIRCFVDTKDAPGWMLAGNPVRLDPALVWADNNDRITRAAREGNGNWGFAHELGHDFNFAGGEWYYTTFGGLEAWPNIFSVHAQETLGLAPRDLDCVARKQNYLSSANSIDHISKDVWLALCFLLEFKEAYGWQFLRERFSQAAGENVNAIFDEWMIPSR